jgi:XTP/dITP diphosphohydrolase
VALETGEPGNSSDAENNEKLIRLLKEVPSERRTARFRCVLALVPIHPQSSIRHPQSFGGACEGRIGFEPEGDHGFGYDPLFLPDGFRETFAQLGEQTKNRISHRSRALAAMQQWLTHPAG